MLCCLQPSSIPTVCTQNTHKGFILIPGLRHRYCSSPSLRGRKHKAERDKLSLVAMVVEEENVKMGFSKHTKWESPDSPPKSDDYILLDGKRLVRPYYFEFIAYVKQRWSGKKIEDVFSHEFRKRSYEYFVKAINLGRIRVDDRVILPGYIVKTTEKLSHFVHRHEPPVLAEHVEILEDGSDIVTVCKPASIPVHPCGQYRKNTVVGILQAEHGLAPLFPIHRLDRLVSGLLIFAKNSSQADHFREEISAGKVQKEYIAKVIGIFPEGQVEVNANVVYDPREGRSTVEEGCNYSNFSIKGKKACTRFTRICTDGIHSIVKCMPITGRTHQIRVHLQHLGHPIANDPLYCNMVSTRHNTMETTPDLVARSVLKCNETVTEEGSISGSDREKHTSISEEVITSKEMMDDGLNVNQSQSTNHELEFKVAEDAVRSSHTDEPKESSVFFEIDPLCTNCPTLSPCGYAEQEEGLWLHCCRYSGPNWIYECPLPKWASLDKQKRLQVGQI
eukprot:TRINITY_DN13913_c0_g1_i1.p1 TRINITY_DN13913_c0_g1~~TRINITY_DN13913_c0_g1_i1.p1  ORF type:complete len:504 (-),score=89.39 TRINITY_DN13913_c0_g1_i1:392-1903(-)